MRKLIKKWKREQQGNAAVEFAVVLPALLLIILGCIEVSWYLYNRYSVERYAADAAMCVPDLPSGSGWQEGGTPPWMEDGELEAVGGCSGWMTYDAAGVDGEFRSSLASVGTVLDKSNLQVSVDGGWLIAITTVRVPRENLPRELLPEEREKMKEEAETETETEAETLPPWNPEDAYLTKPRTENYYLDADIRVTYTFRPLTFLGGLFFCRDGADTAVITTDYPIYREAGTHLNSYS